METFKRNKAEEFMTSIHELQFAVYITYKCSSCGKNTELKPTDDVACHHCNGNILFKLRKPEVFQTLAR